MPNSLSHFQLKASGRVARSKGPLAQGLVSESVSHFPKGNCLKLKAQGRAGPCCRGEADSGRTRSLLFLPSPLLRHSLSGHSLSTYWVQTLLLAHGGGLEEFPAQHGRQACKEAITVQSAQGRLPMSRDHFFHPRSFFSGASERTPHLKGTDATTVKQQNSLSSHTPSCGCAQMPDATAQLAAAAARQTCPVTLGRCAL